MALKSTPLPLKISSNMQLTRFQSNPNMFFLSAKEKPLLTGKAVGRSIVSGKVSIVKSLADGAKVNAGDIIVADITNPDWNALLKKAVCIVTNKGGRTSHASIIARELGIPAVVGTMSATEKTCRRAGNNCFMCDWRRR